MRFPYPGDQTARVVAAAAAQAPLDALSFLRADGLGHLRFQKLLDDRAHHWVQKIAVFGHHHCDLASCPVTILSGHGSISQLVVDCSQLLTMTFLFSEPSGHYRSSGGF
jgi:hypothetical protein